MLRSGAKNSTLAVWIEKSDKENKGKRRTGEVVGPPSYRMETKTEPRDNTEYADIGCFSPHPERLCVHAKVDELGVLSRLDLPATRRGREYVLRNLNI